MKKPLGALYCAITGVGPQQTEDGRSIQTKIEQLWIDDARRRVVAQWKLTAIEQTVLLAVIDHSATTEKELEEKLGLNSDAIGNHLRNIYKKAGTPPGPVANLR
jgi:DNA-binding CsgD family transcriptional regulator